MISEMIEKLKTTGPWPRRLIVVVAVLAVWAISLRGIAHETSWVAAAFFATPGMTAILLMFTPKATGKSLAFLKGISVAALTFIPLWEAGLIWFCIAIPLCYAAGVVAHSLIKARAKKGQSETMDSWEKLGRINSAQWWVISLTVAFTIGGVLYHLLMKDEMGHSALMFLGIPAVLAIVLALTPKAKSVTGGILKGITLALLIIAPLLGEGYLCILMASPLFYVVGIGVGAIVDYRRRGRNATLSCLALVLLPMSLEGVIPALTFNRTQTVEVSQVVNAPADAVEHQLALSPDITTELPAPLRIGFPRPLAATGEGLEIGAMRTIHFAGAEGDPPGDLTMRVAAREPGFIRFQTVSDTSKLTQWIAWDSSEVRWQQIDATHTEVRWRVQFERQLDPAWYFTPLERGAIHEAAKYLIDANATPQAARAKVN
jgi:hypothetical protein